MNLVNELQVSAESDDVLTVLRKTTRLASKLDRDDMAEWLQAEQAGYAQGQAVPEYRDVRMSLAYNTNGYVPAGFGHVKSGVEDLPPSGFNVPISIRDSISTILSFINSINAGNGVYLPIPEGTELGITVRSAFHCDPTIKRQLSFLMHLDEAQIKAIPERIKDKVLVWACALERAGVTGEGMSFTEKEKKIAHTITFNISGSHIEQLNNLGANFKAP